MISTVVLTHNSARTLSDTLASLVWSDELLVIDDESTDETAAIAQRFRARVVRHALVKDFATQRNFGLAQARGDWVLFVDADEVVSPALAAEIQKAIKDSVIDGYFLTRQDRLWGRVLRHGETNAVRLMRLGRRGAGKWTRPVHEVWEIHGYTKTLKVPLLHFPHPDVAQFLADINEYSSANAEYLYQRNVRVSCLAIIAYPAAKFFVNYIWRQGWRDKTPGVIIALMMSFHSFLTRAKVWHLWQKGV